MGTCYNSSTGTYYRCGFSTYVIGVVVAAICIKLLLGAYFYRRRKLRKQQDIENAVNAALANQAAAGIPPNGPPPPNYPHTMPMTGGPFATGATTTHEPGVVHVGGARMRVDDNGKIEECSCGINHGGHVDVRPAKRLDPPSAIGTTAAGASSTSLPPYTRHEPPPSSAPEIQGLNR